MTYDDVAFETTVLLLFYMTATHMFAAHSELRDFACILRDRVIFTLCIFNANTVLVAFPAKDLLDVPYAQ